MAGERVEFGPLNWPNSFFWIQSAESPRDPLKQVQSKGPPEGSIMARCLALKVANLSAGRDVWIGMGDP